MREKQKTTKAGGLTPEQQEKWKAIFAKADARWKKEKAALAQAEELVLCRNPEDLDAALFQLLDARDMIFEAADFGIRAPTDAEFSSEWNDAEECALSHEDIAWQYIWQIKKAKRYIELIEKLCERYSNFSSKKGRKKKAWKNGDARDLAIEIRKLGRNPERGPRNYKAKPGRPVGGGDRYDLAMAELDARMKDGTGRRIGEEAAEIKMKYKLPQDKRTLANRLPKWRKAHDSP